MEKIYSVVSSLGNVMGQFTTEEKALACLRYYISELPDHKIEIDWNYVDLIDYKEAYLQYEED